MTVYPAVDLRSGRCVRLVQGDPGRETVFADDPAEAARAWVAAGAGWLHVVDLDGAFAGHPVQLEALRAIARSGVPVQFGGGLRTPDDVAAAFAAGATRVVIGTRALDPEFARAALEHWPDRVAFALDARDGMVTVAGWQAPAGVTVAAAAARLALAGARDVLYTNVARDGMLGGPDVDGTEALVRLGLRVIASGGVTTLDDVRRVRATGASGVVIGRALYDGRLALPDALAAAGERSARGEPAQTREEARGC